MQRFSETLAYSELKKYKLDAQLIFDNSLAAFEIRCTDGKAVIAASNEIELLYGVYEFAERFGGWSFFEPGTDRFDITRKITDLPDGVLLKSPVPLLKRRGFIQEFPFDDETEQLFDWMAKNKLNYLLVWMKYYDELSDELKEFARLRGIEIESGHHNFNYWIPGQTYGKSHPHFFAETNGKRITPSGNSELLLSEQLCTTNPELRSEIVRRMEEYCDKHPEVKKISLIPNDGFGWCECENCSKFYDKEQKGDFYSVSRHVYRANTIYHDMVKDIAARLHKTRPDIQITFCAYVNYCTPAKNFTLEQGMAVHMAPYWRCINHALDDPSCEINSNYLRDITQWCNIKNGGEVNIYEYYMGINFYLSLPMIHWEKMFREARWYNEHKVDGVLTQFHLAHWRVYGMNYRLMAQALRGEDEKTSIWRQLETLFGKDAGEAEIFYREIEQTMQNMGQCHIPYPRSLFRRTELKHFEHIHELACQLAKKSPKDRFRCELTVWTEYLIRFKKLADKLFHCQATCTDVDDLLKWVHSFKDSRIFVHAKFDMYFDAVKDVIKAGKPWIHFNIAWEDEYILEHDNYLK